MNALAILLGLALGQVGETPLLADLLLPQPPPAVEARTAASKTLWEIHGDRLDSTGRDAAALARELLDAGTAAADSPADQWVCWDEARRLALLARDKTLSLEAVRLLAETFQYPEPADQAECIRRAREAWKEAEAKKGDAAWPWRLAAWAWYTQAGSNGELNGLNKVEAEKRIAEVKAEASGLQNVSIVLSGENAQLHGSTIATNPNLGIVAWRNTSDWVSWEVNVPPGRCDVLVEYACHQESSGGVASVEVMHKTGRRVLAKDLAVQSTGEWDRYISATAGSFSLTKSGAIVIAVRPIKKPGEALMNLRSVQLIFER